MEETRLAYAEINKILELLEDDYKNRVPGKIRDFFRDERDIEYEPTIEPNKLLSEQNLKNETYILLTILELNYWCDSEEEKQELLLELSNNEEKKQKELYKKYNPDKIFKKKNETYSNNEETAVVVYKEHNFIKKIIDRIVSFFRREK